MYLVMTSDPVDGVKSLEVWVFRSKDKAKAKIKEMVESMNEFFPKVELPDLDGPLPIRILGYPVDITFDIPFYTNMS